MADTPLIVCSNLTHTYPNGVTALKDINLTISRGEYVAFVGQNGSGKTTLVKHFNGLLKPTTPRASLSSTENSTSEASRESSKGASTQSTVKPSYSTSTLASAGTTPAVEP